MLNESSRKLILIAVAIFVAWLWVWLSPLFLPGKPTSAVGITPTYTTCIGIPVPQMVMRYLPAAHTGISAADVTYVLYIQPEIEGNHCIGQALLAR